MNERNTFNMVTLELFIFQLTFILQIKNTLVRDECSSSLNLSRWAKSVTLHSTRLRSSFLSLIVERWHTRPFHAQIATIRSLKSKIQIV